MEIEWAYDNPHGGSIDVDPMDFDGMSESEIFEVILSRCKKDAKSVAMAYVPGLSGAVADIVAALKEGENG